VFDDFYNSWMDTYESTGMLSVRKGGAAALCILMFVMGTDFVSYSQEISWSMSSPSIMYKANLRNGQTIMVDDYREAYWWLRDNTAPDARVMAWWDYGYQIAGIANRTTIADGNTWNHEHIATLGRCLTSPEKDAHRLVRHLADYVLVWTGGGGDDLAKSPHMARIGTSVYSDICPGDPTCSQFGFTDRQQTPTPMMEASLLYKLHGHNQRPGVKVDPDRFREAFTSKYNKVRIFKVLKVSKKSKDWVDDPANKQCDAPGSWYCTGQYPPALDDLFKKKKAFKQLEDFNAEGGDSSHYEEYMARMAGAKAGGGEENEMVKKAKAEKERARKRKEKEAADIAAGKAPKKRRGKKGEVKSFPEQSTLLQG
jgi:dolichyl-diphosphooligosaccharide--protein glycosyltransferase